MEKAADEQAQVAIAARADRLAAVHGKHATITSSVILGPSQGGHPG
jgi:hypothetical protein